MQQVASFSSYSFMAFGVPRVFIQGNGQDTAELQNQNNYGQTIDISTLHFYLGSFIKCLYFILNQSNICVVKVVFFLYCTSLWRKKHLLRNHKHNYFDDVVNQFQCEDQHEVNTQDGLQQTIGSLCDQCDLEQWQSTA